MDEGRRRLLMVFTGQGTQWAGCGRALYDAHPVFRRAVDAIEEHWREHSGTVICGTEPALRPVVEELERRNLQHRLLPGNIAFHSAAMDPLHEDAFAALAFLNDCAFDAAVPFVSSVTGAHTERLDNAYWWTNIRQRVRFAAALDTAVRDFRPDVVLEIAPHSALQSAIIQCLEGSGSRAVCIPTLRRDSDVCLGFHAALGALFRAGVELDFAAQYPRPEPIAHLLPGYPRDEHTTADEMSDDEMFLQAGEYAHGPLIGHRVPCDHLLFEARMSERDFPWLAEHRVHHASNVPLRLTDIDSSGFEPYYYVGDSDFYERIDASLGETFQYGPYFRNIQRVLWEDTTANYLFDVEMNEQLWLDGREEGYVANPALLDGGLQIFLYHLLRATDIVAMPRRAVGVTFLRPPTGPRLTCYVKKDPDWADINEQGQFTERRGERSGGSIRFYDGDTGELVLCIDAYVSTPRSRCAPTTTRSTTATPPCASLPWTCPRSRRRSWTPACCARTSPRSCCCTVRRRRSVRSSGACCAAWRSPAAWRWSATTTERRPHRTPAMPQSRMPPAPHRLRTATRSNLPVPPDRGDATRRLRSGRAARERRVGGAARHLPGGGGRRGRGRADRLPAGGSGHRQ